MKLQHLNIKFFNDLSSQELSLETFIPIFHRWIQQKVTEEMLIDVADYAHVPAGPGVLLVGHHANLSIDCLDSSQGFLYNRKVADEGSNQEILEANLRRALVHVERLEQEPELKGKLRFSRNHLKFIVNDRLLAPNNSQNLEEFKNLLSEVLPKVMGVKTYSFIKPSDPRDRLSLEVKAD